MNKMIIIVGPTASGKSDLAIKLAKNLNLEIINADAFQVYKEINAGINKPTKNELKEVKHYFINSKSISDQWNIKIFQNEFNELNKLKKNFIICGGSNLYIDAIINNYNLKEINNEINLDNYSNKELWDMLNKLDYEESQKININNTKRLKHSLKIILSNKEKKSTKDLNNNKCLFEYILINVDIDRESLYEKINKRVYEMIDMDWKEEVKAIMEAKFDFENNNALKAIGYKEVFDSIKNNIEIDINSIQKRTRNYAKRQITWIKNKFKINFTFNKEKTNYEEILKNCKDFLNEK